MTRLLRRLRVRKPLNEEIKERSRKYREIEDIVFGFNRDENIYDKYQRIVRVVTRE